MTRELVELGETLNCRRSTGRESDALLFWINSILPTGQAKPSGL